VQAHPGEFDRRAGYGLDAAPPRERFAYFDERKQAPLSPSAAVPIPIQQSAPSSFSPGPSGMALYRRDTDESSYFPPRTPTPSGQALARVAEENDFFAFENEPLIEPHRGSESERRSSVTSQVTSQIYATHGLSTNIGARTSNQDRFQIVTDLQTAFGVVQYYAIYDGHCGPEVATFAAEHLHQLLVHFSTQYTSLLDAAREAFLELDRRVLVNPTLRLSCALN